MSLLEQALDPETRRIRGEVIRAARLARGWSQPQLARHIGVNSQTISRWETGYDKRRLHPKPGLYHRLVLQFLYETDRILARQQGGEAEL